MDKKIVRNIAIALGIVVFFLVLSYGFVPQVLQGKIVNQSDISGFVGMAHEMSEWDAAHPDDPARWTGSMFGGMPTTTISLRNSGDWTQALYDFLLTGKRPATYLFIALLGSFLLLLSLGVSLPVAVGGAVAMAFCSYNFQIIQVGHNTKMQAIAFLPWVLAALVYTYRSATAGGGEDRKRRLAKTVFGAVLFALALSLQIKANHQQITYYLAIMVLLYALVLFVWLLVRDRKALGRFFAASALLLVIGTAGIATNANKLLPLYRYTPHTMRGGSELTRDGSGSGKGLDLDYATAWSYGWEELPNLMIPNFNGGASAAAVNPEKSETIKLLRRAGQGHLRETAKNLPMYWGPQPFTAGPMYMGAITIFLFVLGLCLYRGREKWWLILATVLAVLLAVGNHFMAFTKLCFNILPLYNKFRAVSMALIVLQYTLPMLGFLTLDGIVRERYSREEFMKGGLIALAVTGGFCLLCWLIPGIAGSFTGAGDAGQQEILVDAFVADRKMLFRADALLSAVLILAAWLLLFWAYLPDLARNKAVAARDAAAEHRSAFAATGRKTIAAVLICLLSFLNLFAVGKRYLNAEDFVTPKAFNNQFAERPVDKIIKEDPDASYRVLDLTANIFNDSHASYHHKNVGGYSPAKLQRYQDLIEHYLTPEINALYGALRGVQTVQDFEASLPQTPFLNALNTRYLIVGGDNAPAVNPSAFGNAWFVDSLVVAATPDEEIALAGQVDLRRQSVVQQKAEAEIRTALAGSGSAGSPEDRIELTGYAPNELTFRYSAAAARVAVLSEVYYPDGWNAWIDGDRNAAVPVFCADWTLRGTVLPAGDHELTLRFEPQSYRQGRSVSRASSILLVLLLLLSAAGMVVFGRKVEKIDK